MDAGGDVSRQRGQSFDAERIERGRPNLTLVVAHRIALAFGMSLGELIEKPGTACRGSGLD